MDREYIIKKPGGALPTPAEIPATAAEASLAPGIRFHPSDEELISYYLKREVQGKPMRLDAIGEVDIYKHEPWDLAVHSKSKKRDKEWFIFSGLDKNPAGASVKRSRTTKQGYWNITGKDREIRRGDGKVIIGMIKILMLYTGRAPYGRRTNWVMHEYRLTENDERPSDAYVLCRVFLKQNTWKPSGSRYAPFLEEGWDDDVERAVSPVPVVVDADRINEIQQIDDNNKKVDDEPLKRDSSVAPLPYCVLDKEAPLHLVQYKRKRPIDSNGNSNSSSQITQDHCSSTETIVDTGAAEPLEISERVAISVIESSFASMIDDLENEQEPVAKMVPASSFTKRIKDLLKEKDEMVVFRETQTRERMEVEVVINYLEDMINTLGKENEELRKNKSNKGQPINYVVSDFFFLLYFSSFCFHGVSRGLPSHVSYVDGLGFGNDVKLYCTIRIK